VVSDTVNPYEVYKSIYQCELGKQLGQVFRAVVFVLHRWCQFGILKPGSPPKSPRSPAYERPDNGCMTLIEFDKLMNVLCRVWGKMFSVYGEEYIENGTINTLSEQELQRIVRFKPPLDEIPGRHGPGEARQDEFNDPPSYAVDMLTRLSVQESIPYVDIRKNDDSRSSTGPRKAARESVKSLEEIVYHKDYIIPGIGAFEDVVFWGGFTQFERNFLVEFADALKHLGPIEIRALGTHRTSEQTVEEVKRELRWARAERDKILACLEGKIKIRSEDARKFQNFAREAFLKADENRKAYEEAFRRVLDELSSSDIKQAFTDSQKTVFEIWECKPVKDLRKTAHTLYQLADYIWAIAYFDEHPDARRVQTTRETGEAMHCWEHGLVHAKHLGLPDSIDKVFAADRDCIAEDVRERLIEVLRACV
jgi:hypothetical protein